MPAPALQHRPIARLPARFQRLLGCLIGVAAAYGISRHLSALPSTFLTALLLAGGSVASGRALAPWAWWGVLGAGCGGLLGSAMVVAEKIQATDPREGLSLRLALVGCLMVAGAIGGRSFSLDAAHPNRRPPKDTLRAASALNAARQHALPLAQRRQAAHAPQVPRGRLLARHLARAAPPTLKWALAARSQAKMQELRDELARETPALASLPLLVANSDEAGAALVASSASVVISTAGPFALCGSALVGACARAGTHYADATGETFWVADMIAKHDAAARAAKAIIVPLSGFDSVPSDLGALFVADCARASSPHSTPGSHHSSVGSGSREGAYAAVASSGG
jgi:hypothetical protein